MEGSQLKEYTICSLHEVKAVSTSYNDVAQVCYLLVCLFI